MQRERHIKKPLGGYQISSLAKPELDRITMAVNGALQVHPRAAHLDIGHIDVPLSADGALATTKALQHFGRVADSPSVDRHVIDQDAPLRHHLFKVTQVQGGCPAHPRSRSWSLSVTHPTGHSSSTAKGQDLWRQLRWFDGTKGHLYNRSERLELARG